MVLAVSVIVGVIMAVLLFRLFFKDLGDFIECVRFYFQPDWISMFRGEWLEDFWGTTKLGVWAVLSVGMGVATFYKGNQFFPDSKPRTVAKESAARPVNGRTITPARPAHEVKTRAESPLGEVSKAASVATNSPAPAPAAGSSRGGNLYGVKVGDTVEISAVNPPIALRRATITMMNDEQVAVRGGFDDYTVRWKDVTKLKAAAQ